MSELTFSDIVQDDLRARGQKAIGDHKRFIASALGGLVLEGVFVDLYPDKFCTPAQRAPLHELGHAIARRRYCPTAEVAIAAWTNRETTGGMCGPIQSLAQARAEYDGKFDSDMDRALGFAAAFVAIGLPDPIPEVEENLRRLFLSRSCFELVHQLLALILERGGFIDHAEVFPIIDAALAS
jgi:hypothetical protein